MKFIEPQAHSPVSESPEPTQDEKPQERAIRGWRWFLVMTAVLSTVFLFALDNSIVADVQPAIVNRFHSVAKLPWLSVSFTLGAAGLSLTWGRLYSQFDTKYLYLIGLFFFEAGSAICGASNTIDVLIFGRALAGLGGSGYYVGVMTMISAFTLPKERPIYMAGTGVLWGAGSVLGPVIGGAFADSSATWRWAFYINLVVAGVFLPVYLGMLPTFDPRRGAPLKSRLGAIDYVGSLLIIGALICGIMAINFGGIIYEWSSGRIIALLVLSGVFWIAFGVQQVYCIFTTEATRLFPVHFLKDRSLAILFLQALLAGCPIFIPIYFIPLLFQFTQGDSALDGGVRLLPFMFLLVFFCLVNGAIMSKEGHYMPWYIGGTALIVIGSALMTTVTPATSAAKVYGYTILIGAGAGPLFQAPFSVSQAMVSNDDMPLVVAMINIAQIGGVTLALTLSNSIFLNLATNSVKHILPGVDLTTIQSALTGSGSAFLQTLSKELRTRVLEAITDSMSRVYYIVLVASAIGFVLSFGMRWEKLDLAML